MGFGGLGGRGTVDVVVPQEKGGGMENTYLYKQ